MALDMPFLYRDRGQVRLPCLPGSGWLPRDLSACLGRGGQIDHTRRAGLTVFPAREGLCRYLAEKNAKVRGKVVVELGGRLSAERDLDADAGAMLVLPERIASVQPLDVELIGDPRADPLDPPLRPATAQRSVMWQVRSLLRLRRGIGAVVETLDDVEREVCQCEYSFVVLSWRARARPRRKEGELVSSPAQRRLARCLVAKVREEAQRPLIEARLPG